MTGLSEFLDMGGYAHFIWPSYAVVAVVMVLTLIVVAFTALYFAYRVKKPKT